MPPRPYLLALALSAWPGPVPGASANPAPPTLRLPAGVRPLRYRLDLQIVPSAPSYSGTVAIDLSVDAPTSLVWLNASGLAIDGAEVRAGGATQAARILPGGDDHVGFAVDQELAPGPAQLDIRYHGKLDGERSRGIYRQAEGPGPDDWYVYTFFEPTDARRAFPCFDEPAFKVPWQLTFHVRRNHVALGNAPIAAEEDEPDGMKSVRLAESRPLPSYLVAFVVGPFDLVDGGRAGRAGTPIRFIVPRGRGGETRYAREVTPRIVAELERFFDMPYPYLKLDVAVVPRYWGTMEHPGIVALGQPLTLIKTAEEGLHRKQAYANIAIHELAHFWFGDYVTCKWWNDVWLNESLATWADGIVTDAVAPGWKFTLDRDVDWMNAAMAADAQPTAQQIRLPVEDENGIQNAFDADITYRKGSSVLHMIEHWVGVERFRGAVRRYLREHAWRSADMDDFLSSLRAELGPEPAQALASFVDQPGVPMVSADLRCDGKPRVRLSQTRFFAAGDRPSPSTWRLPVCMKFDGGRTCVLLDGPSAEVALASCPGWLMLNEGAAGYYRVRYTGAALASLTPRFATALDVRERQSVAADVGAEAEQGTLPLADALGLVPTLLADGDLRVYRRGVALLSLLKPRELDESGHAAFGRAVTKLVGARAQSIGWVPREGEDPDGGKVRETLLRLMAREAHDGATIAGARRLADRWLGDREAVAPDMVGAVLSIAALGDDPAFFDRLLAEARKTGDRREREQLLVALGDFHAPHLLQRALGILVGSDFDLRETIGIAYRALYARETREQAWTFLREHWDALTSRMREDEVMWLFGGVPGSFCDAGHRREMEEFLAPRARAHPGAPHALSDALEGVKTCSAALARNRAGIAAFLARY